MRVLLPAVLAALAAAVAVRGDDGRTRLSGALPDAHAGMRRQVPVGARGATRAPGLLRSCPEPGRAGRGRWRRTPSWGRSSPGSAGARGPSQARAACVLLGLGVGVLVGGSVGVGLGLLVAAAGPRLLDRLEPRASRAARERFAVDLPAALDLLAACLSGGASLPAAVRGVADAVPGPCGARLARVVAAMDVGAPPSDAWAWLADGEPTGLAPAAARALARAGEGGAPVAAAVARLAEDARAEQRARGEQAAARAGVLAVGPLGLCFLPAFVLLGVVPVVAGLVGPLLADF